VSAWLLCAAAFAGKWTGKPSDVVAERTIAAPPSAVYAVLTDLNALGEIWPERCVSEWVVATPATGAGARTTLRYTIGVVRKRVPAVLGNLQQDRTVDLVHEGKRDLTTRWALTAAGEGTEVTMTTFLTAPPWPLTGPYFTKIKPDWEACQADLLTALAARAETR
jgi:uncharacterized protein YndB with AHSA1/START domain